MTIIVAFILEAFLFRIQFTEFLTKQEEIKKMTTEITLNADEIRMLVQRSGSPEQTSNISNTTYKFIGHKTRTKEQLQSLMYCEEMEQWLAEERLEEARTQARLALLLRADSHGGSDADHITTDAVQVVEDEDEVTTIRRPVLPDVKFA